MARTITKLKPLEVARITAPGIYRVDDGLYLQVESKTARSWLHRYMFRRKQRRSGLGSYPEVSLADARAKRDEERAQLRAGIDPVEARKAERVHACVRQVKTITFQECGEACINDHKV